MSTTVNVESDRDGHQNVSCSFCGKSQHEVRSLIEGGCRNAVKSPCVFICNECVEFCAQVIADNGWGRVPAVTASRANSEGAEKTFSRVKAYIDKAPKA